MNKPFNAKFFNSVEYCGKTSSYVNQQEVTESFRLSPGTYCIVPSTFLVNQESPFAMRVFTESANDLRENDISMEHLAVCDEQFNTVCSSKCILFIYNILFIRKVNWRPKAKFISISCT